LQAQKQPYLALVTGLLVPGLGHFYAGRRRAAMLAFLAVTACFGLGWVLADYRLFAFTSPLFAGNPILSRLPIHLLPEAGNFLETAVAWWLQPSAADPERGALLRLPIAAEHWGLALSGVSGYLNCILAADACWLVARGNLAASRRQEMGGRPALSVLLGWLVPGLGHAAEGRRTHAWLVGGCISVLFGLGLVFSGCCGVDRPQLYWWWAAQAGLGGPTFVASVLLGPLRIEHDIATIDLGITLLTIAGLLNVVALTDVYSLGERRALAGAKHA
jgi:hypothetical protein